MKIPIKMRSIFFWIDFLEKRYFHANLKFKEIITLVEIEAEKEYYAEIILEKWFFNIKPMKMYITIIFKDTSILTHIDEDGSIPEGKRYLVDNRKDHATRAAESRKQAILKRLRIRHR